MQTRQPQLVAGVSRKALAVFLLREAGWSADAVSRIAEVDRRTVGVYVNRVRRVLDGTAGKG